ncbi:MAG: hypothetical protein A3I66_09005 [Burkholderiales bacterium RIFCSPLOWO2_02_FULL_57_36]|nr:MAG: hypothetical protein A3I66_09005 [Burkholderiales bacterium RIFCSPLOWO2_02_FULL_57_36]
MRWLRCKRSSKINRAALTVLTVFITLLYPLAIWLGHGQVEPRLLAGILLLAALTRLPALKVSKMARWWMGGALLLAAIAVWANAMLPLKLYPVLVSAVMLAVFGYTLVKPPSMVERFARMREPDLPPAAIGYTRRVTQVWCGFFAINGAIALSTALWASPAVWSIYNGVVSYLLMGLLFGGEFLTRLYFKRRHSV